MVERTLGFQPRLASPIKNHWPAALSCPATAVVSAHCGPCLWTIQAAAGWLARNRRHGRLGPGWPPDSILPRGSGAARERAPLVRCRAYGRSHGRLPAPGTRIEPGLNIGITPEACDRDRR